MLLILQTAEPSEYNWLAPYALVLALFWMVYMFFRLFETWYANKTNNVLYRDILVFRTLSRKQKQLLFNSFSFYRSLGKKQKRRFEHRVSYFIKDKTFVGREELVVTEDMKLLIAGLGCTLTFGRKNYDYRLIESILIYPKAFYSTINEQYHKGEFNPRQKALVISWEDFEHGYRITDDNLNLGIHEFMHALQLDARKSTDIDALRFERKFQEILKLLTIQETKEKLEVVKYFRAYAFTNQFEFMAVLAEYFLESPADFNTNFPALYGEMKSLLNFNFPNY